MPRTSFAACVPAGSWPDQSWHWFTCLFRSVYDSKEKYASHCASSDTGTKTHCFSREAAMWNIYSNFKTVSCCSLACRQPRPTPSQPEGRSCKGASCSLRADLPKLVTQFWDSKPTSKVCFDRLSTSPHPSRASINPGRGVPRSWSCVHVNCQLVATGGKQKVKGRAGHPDSAQETWPTRRAEEAQRPRPQSQHTLPATCLRLPQRPFQQ